MKSIESLNQDLQTPEICLHNIRLGVHLRDVRKDLRTEEICLEAVKRNERDIVYVPEEVLTEEMVRIAAVFITTCRGYLALIPSKFKTDDFYIEAISRINIMNDVRILLINLPKERRNFNICLAAVSKFGMALSCVPRVHRTDELCLIAVKNNGLALRYVNNPTLEICIAAIDNNEEAIKYVPEEFMTKLGVNKKWA